MYYLRTKPAAAAIQFTIDKTKVAGNFFKLSLDLTPATNASRDASKKDMMAQIVKQAADVVGETCRMEEGCLTCGS